MNTTHFRGGLVLKLGGSILHPKLGTINTPLLESLKSLLIDYIQQTSQPVFLILGGGAVNKIYTDHLIGRSDIPDSDRDWLGIYTIRLNALFVRTFFHDYVYEHICNAPSDIPDKVLPQIYICGAEKPGHSGNYDAVEFAQHIQADTLINISNIDYVFDGDPRSSPHAKPWASVTWDDYIHIIPKEWTPRASYPFDPISSRLARDLGLQVWFLSGENISEIAQILETNTTTKGTLLGAFETKYL